MSRVRTLFEILNTAQESGASGVRIRPKGSVLLRIDGCDTCLDGARIATEDLRELAGYIAGRALASVDGQDRQTLVYRMAALGPFEFQVKTESGPHGHTLILEPIDSQGPNGLTIPDRFPAPAELAIR